MDAKNFIAKRVSKELESGDVVNLGIGLPTLVANYIPEDVEVIFQSENGILGLGPVPEKGKEDKDIFNAGGGLVTVVPGAQFFSSADFKRSARASACCFCLKVIICFCTASSSSSRSNTLTVPPG